MIQHSFSATRIFVAAFGALVVGVAGIEHGIGEALQGNVAPDGFFILSWPGSDLFSVGNDNPDLLLVLLLGMVGFFFATIFTGFAFDSLGQNDALLRGGIQNQLTSTAASELKG